jgi:hypothetical protein
MGRKFSKMEDCEEVNKDNTVDTEAEEESEVVDLKLIKDRLQAARSGF